MSDASVDDQQVLNKTKAPTKEQVKVEKEESASAHSYKKGKSDQLVMHVKVYSPFKDYYDGQAFSVSAENLTGPFDVLPRHHSFISLLSPCDLVVRTPDENSSAIRIKIAGGLMHVKADEVIVFLDV
ncbi:MAG TPA: hypothetical protein VL989_01050 [Candidatus Sulfotelmatobacter sp.]|nr:hypothetical protein [Candidatus Sulfotelmatobacter sp.]